MGKSVVLVIDMDKDDLIFVGGRRLLIERRCVVKESKLVQMVDALGLWADIGGKLELDK